MLLDYDGKTGRSVLQKRRNRETDKDFLGDDEDSFNDSDG